MNYHPLERRLLCAAGELEPSFADAGRFSTSLSQVPHGSVVVPLGTVVQADGKIVTAVLSDKPAGNAYQVSLVRLSVNGVLDATFGNAGVAAPVDAPYAVASDHGKLILAANGDFLAIAGGRIYRFDPDGTLDPTFSGDGVFDLSTYVHNYAFHNRSDQLSDIAELANGRIVAAGDSTIVLLNADGTGDNQFGFGSGIADMDPTNVGLHLVDVAVPTGAVVFTGYFQPSSGDRQLFLWKTQPDMRAPLAGFGDSMGRVITNFSGWAFAVYDAEWQDKDNGVLLISSNDPSLPTQLIRVLPDGTTNYSPTSTGQHLRRSFYAGANGVIDRDIVLGASGTIYLIGSRPGGAANVWVSRFNSNLTPDFSFSEDGHAHFDLAGAGAVAVQAALTANNGLLVIGHDAAMGETVVGKLQAGASGSPMWLKQYGGKYAFTIDLSDRPASAVSLLDRGLRGFTNDRFDAIGTADLIYEFSPLTIDSLRIVLDDGNDSVWINSPNSTAPLSISAGGGNDTVRTGAAKGYIDLGTGDDTAELTRANATVLGGAGDDRIVGIQPDSRGSDYFYGGDGNDTLIGGAGGTDALYGDAGDDSIIMYARGVAYGGDGRDTIRGSKWADTLAGESGDDRIDGLGGDDAINGGAGRDTLLGGDGNDRILGNNDPDRLYGDAGNDNLDGGQGSDYLSGGAGNDRLTGSTGNNIFLARDKTPDILSGRGAFLGTADEIDTIIGLVLT